MLSNRYKAVQLNRILPDEADRIRQELLTQGIVLKDSASGTTWEAAQ